MSYNSSQNTEFKSGSSPSTGTPALGSIFEAEFNRIYANFAATFGTDGLLLPQVAGDSVDAATEKTTPIDSDEVGLKDSGASNILKKLTWANIKATLKTYFDTLYVALTGTQTIAGLKTFSSLLTATAYMLTDKITAYTSGAGVGIGTVDGSVLRTKILEIGDWDMDANASVNVAHGITDLYLKVRGIEVMIRGDVAGVYTLYGGGYALVVTSNITLNRTASSLFDSVSFDSTSYNRGWITIHYVD